METTATTKGQIVIPAELRKKLYIKEGTRIRVELDEEHNRIILTPVTREYIHSLRGSLKGKHVIRVVREGDQLSFLPADAAEAVPAGGSA